MHQNGLIRRDLTGFNIGALLGADYYRSIFAQNLWVERLAAQFGADIDQIIPPAAYSLSGDDRLMELLQNDRVLAPGIFEDFILPTRGEISGSLLAGYFHKLLSAREIRKAPRSKQAHSKYPKGVPLVTNAGIPYLNEVVFSGVLDEILKLESQPQPYFAYYHFWSPHFPYKPSRDYNELFNDDFQPPEKPLHPLGSKDSREKLLADRLDYDRQVAQVDFEFGQLMDVLQRNGVLDHGTVIVTSDHGEMFERGHSGHGTRILFEPVIKIPLMISTPGQSARADVFTPTSNADILPTLLALTGREIPAELEGRILPGFGGEADDQRPIFSMSLQDNSAFLPLTHASISMRKGAYRLTGYFGYPEYLDMYELYNLQNDPEEMSNLFNKETAIAAQLKDELLSSLDAANEPYRTK
jgi:arylsulfatase A-like enzyme